MRTPPLTILLVAGALLASSTSAHGGDASVESRLKAQELAYKVDDDGDYRMTVSWKQEDRSQLVFVSGKTEEFNGVQIREVFAPAARLDVNGLTQVQANNLLADASKRKFGGWEVSGSTLYFKAKLAEPMNPKLLHDIVLAVAEAADNMELEITPGKDDL